MDESCYIDVGHCTLSGLHNSSSLHMFLEVPMCRDDKTIVGVCNVRER